MSMVGSKKERGFPVHRAQFCVNVCLTCGLLSSNVPHMAELIFGASMLLCSSGAVTGAPGGCTAAEPVKPGFTAGHHSR